METAKLSKSLLRRLPLYLEYLKNLPGENPRVSATSIAAALNMGQVQVRKDLAKIAGEGRCRTGRCRDPLVHDIEIFINDSFHTASVLIGSCSTNAELLDQCNFAAFGVNVVACFEMNPTLKHTPCGRPIYPITRLESFCRYYNVTHGIIASPPEEAQIICDCLIACGIHSVWNLTQTLLHVPSGVRLRSGDTAELM